MAYILLYCQYAAIPHKGSSTLVSTTIQTFYLPTALVRVGGKSLFKVDKTPQPVSFMTETLALLAQSGKDLAGGYSLDTTVWMSNSPLSCSSLFRDLSLRRILRWEIQTCFPMISWVTRFWITVRSNPRTKSDSVIVITSAPNERAKVRVRDNCNWSCADRADEVST